MATGTILLLGSGEFEPWTEPVERIALARAAGDGSVVILPTASAPEGDVVFRRWASMGLSHYASMDVPARALELRTRDDAEDADVAADIADASMLFFSGGSPRYLADTLAGTRFWAAALEALARGVVYAGCSAGAMVVGRRPARRPVLGGRWLVGLDLVPHARFGAHWNRMRYLPGLRGARDGDGGWFVGIDERTAILGDGRTWTVHGRASVEVRGQARGSYRDGESFTLA